MLEIFLLMVLGKAQANIGKAWHWALVFALLSSVLSGFALLVLLIKMLIACKARENFAIRALFFCIGFLYSHAFYLQ